MKQTVIQYLLTIRISQARTLLIRFPEKKVQEIAAARVVEVVTVKTQIKGLLHKFGCSRTKEVVQMIRDLNLEHLFM